MSGLKEAKAMLKAYIDKSSPSPEKIQTFCSIAVWHCELSVEEYAELIDYVKEMNA